MSWFFNFPLIINNPPISLQKIIPTHFLGISHNISVSLVVFIAVCINQTILRSRNFLNSSQTNYCVRKKIKFAVLLCFRTLRYLYSSVFTWSLKTDKVIVVVFKAEFAVVIWSIKQDFEFLVINIFNKVGTCFFAFCWLGSLNKLID